MLETVNTILELATHTCIETVDKILLDEADSAGSWLAVRVRAAIDQG